MSSIVDRFIHQYGRLPTEVDPDYLEMLRMSKYRILAVPDVNPGKCSNCGASKNDGREYVDFGLQVDWYGVVFLCGRCLFDIASNMGLFRQLEQQLEDVTTALNNITDLKEQGVGLYEKVIQAFKEFEVYYASLYSLSDDSTPDDNVSVGTDETADQSGTNSPKPRATESTTSGRSSSVPSLAELIDRAT